MPKNSSKSHTFIRALFGQFEKSFTFVDQAFMKKVKDKIEIR